MALAGQMIDLQPQRAQSSAAAQSSEGADQEPSRFSRFFSDITVEAIKPFFDVTEG